MLLSTRTRRMIQGKKHGTKWPAERRQRQRKFEGAREHNRSDTKRARLANVLAHAHRSFCSTLPPFTLWLSERWMWHPEPVTEWNGLAMNVTEPPSWSATSFKLRERAEKGGSRRHQHVRCDTTRVAEQGSKACVRHEAWRTVSQQRAKQQPSAARRRRGTQDLGSLRDH